MTDEERARKIANVAWEIQPSFRHRFKSAEELTQRILAGRQHTRHLGFFLPVCILETFCTIDSMRSTIAHSEMDEVMGVSTTNPDAVVAAKNMLSQLEPVMPTFESYCGDWVNGGD